VRYGDKVPGIGEAKKAGFLPRRTDCRWKWSPRFNHHPRNDWTTPARSSRPGPALGGACRDQASREVWERVEKHFQETHNADGGWGYGRGVTTGSMTCAGLASLTLPAIPWPGEVPPDLSSVEGLEWLAAIHSRGKPEQAFRSLLLPLRLERFGVLASTEFLGSRNGIRWEPATCSRSRARTARGLPKRARHRRLPELFGHLLRHPVPAPGDVVHHPRPAPKSWKYKTIDPGRSL